MTLASLFEKELRWLRHNVVAVLLVLLVLPSLFAASTVAFQQAIPRDTPIAVVAEDESVTDDELDAVKGVSAFFSRPHVYESEASAVRALHREEVYAIFTVPHGLSDEDAALTIQMTVEEEMVPYEQPSLVIRNILARQVGDTFPADVSVERTTVGEDRTLSEFLVSVGTILLTMVYAFAYLPRVVENEQSVFRRVRVESSLSRLLGVKFAVFTPLMVLPVIAFQSIANYLQFRLDLLTPGAVAATLLTFVSLTAIALGVMFFVRFQTVGRMINAALLFGTLAFSNLVYPAGFFSPLRRTITHLSPIHYAMVVQRGVSLKGNEPALYADRIGFLIAFTLGALAFLALGVAYYQRRA
jgi:ABC-2 type transport system permease protein